MTRSSMQSYKPYDTSATIYYPRSSMQSYKPYDTSATIYCLRSSSFTLITTPFAISIPRKSSIFDMLAGLSTCSFTLLP
jgi:hypothetical protein